MFTGIVAAVGQIVRVGPGPSATRVVVDASSLGIDDVGIGDSVALGGCCLTVVGMDAGRSLLEFDVSAETLSVTRGLDRVGPVNLEKALRLSDRLGGHLVSGHVDGVGVVTRFAPVPGDAGSRLLEIDAPSDVAPFIAPKGSVAVDGVSLTTNAVDGNRFSVNLIPHTLAVTTLGALQPGAQVNLEVDVVARYVARFRDFEGN